MKIKFTQPAVDDLAQIGRYTRKHWGKTQAERYQTVIAERIRWISRNKRLWKARPELGDGIFIEPADSHIIVFWEKDLPLKYLGLYIAGWMWGITYSPVFIPLLLVTE